MIQHLVGHIGELHRLPLELPAANAEEDFGVHKHLRGRKTETEHFVSGIIIKVITFILFFFMTRELYSHNFGQATVLFGLELGLGFWFGIVAEVSYK